MPALYEPYVGKAWADILRNFDICAMVVLVSGEIKFRRAYSQPYGHASDINLYCLYVCMWRHCSDMDNRYATYL